MSEICIDGRLLQEYFYCYLQQIMFAVQPYCNTKCHPKPNLKNVKYRSVFRSKDFVPHSVKQLNAMFKKWLVIQCIRWLSKFDKPYSWRLVLTMGLTSWEVGLKLPPPYIFLDRELLLTNLKLGIHTKQHKNFQKSKKKNWIRCDIFYWRHNISTFSAGNLAFACFC